MQSKAPPKALRSGLGFGMPVGTETLNASEHLGLITILRPHRGPLQSWVLGPVCSAVPRGL